MTWTIQTLVCDAVKTEQASDSASWLKRLEVRCLGVLLLSVALFISGRVSLYSKRPSFTSSTYY